MATATLNKAQQERRTSTLWGYAPKDLPDDVIVGAARYALMVRGTDKMIPHEQVFKNVYDAMGWEYEDSMV